MPKNLRRTLLNINSLHCPACKTDRDGVVRKKILFFLELRRPNWPGEGGASGLKKAKALQPGFIT
jgi:hypothetical protein